MRIVLYDNSCGMSGSIGGKLYLSSSSRTRRLAGRVYINATILATMRLGFVCVFGFTDFVVVRVLCLGVGVLVWFQFVVAGGDIFLFLGNLCVCAF